VYLGRKKDLGIHSEGASTSSSLWFRVVFSRHTVWVFKWITKLNSIAVTRNFKVWSASSESACVQNFFFFFFFEKLFFFKLSTWYQMPLWSSSSSLFVSRILVFIFISSSSCSSLHRGARGSSHPLPRFFFYRGSQGEVVSLRELFLVSLRISCFFSAYFWVSNNFHGAFFGNDDSVNESA